MRRFFSSKMVQKILGLFWKGKKIDLNFGFFGRDKNSLITKKYGTFFRLIQLFRGAEIYYLFFTSTNFKCSDKVNCKL